MSIYKGAWCEQFQIKFLDCLDRELKMITSFCFFVTLVGAIFLFRFICIVLHFFIFKEEGGSQKSVLNSQIEEKKVLDQSESDGEEEEEGSMFEFKFNYQIAADSIIDSNAANRQSLLQKDISCFREESQNLNSGHENFHVIDFFEKEQLLSVGKSQNLNHNDDDDDDDELNLITDNEDGYSVKSLTIDSETDRDSSQSFDSDREELQISDETGENQDLEYIWEHQDLIEQLRMELRKIEATGLPTISEESDSPMYIQNLKRWKIDSEFLQEHPMDKLQKYHKSYREKMRKLDLLYHQKMYAIGFLQLKDPIGSLGLQQKTTIISYFRNKSSHSGHDGPSKKLAKDFQSDMEAIYTGQTCLSWDFLRWQYEMFQQVSESDDSLMISKHHYSKVTEEFQQFQVLIQKLLENENVHGGSRIQNYVKNRCVLRNLLQVPVIKEDCLDEKGRGGNLEYVMEKSMRVFWEFVKTADKDETETEQQQQLAPSDYALWIKIQADLNEKEKKMRMKEMVSVVGKCLVNRFKKRHHSRSRLRQYMFFSQVDMKLVSRVLKLSRLRTDQLLWCQTKLSKISFVDDKLHREPSFALFPC